MVMFDSWNLSVGLRTGQVVELPPFVCVSCSDNDHELCEGLPNSDKTWCDCQHKGSPVERKP